MAARAVIGVCDVPVSLRVPHDRALLPNDRVREYIDPNEVKYKWRIAEVVGAIVEGPQVFHDMVVGNRVEEPLRLIGEYLGFAIPEGHFIAGRVPLLLLKLMKPFLSAFEGSCLFHGRAALPTPLSHKYVTIISAAVDLWSGNLRIDRQLARRLGLSYQPFQVLLNPRAVYNSVHKLVRKEEVTLGTLAYNFGDIGTLAVRHLQGLVRLDEAWREEQREDERQEAQDIAMISAACCLVRRGVA